ncbi:MAG TPA: BA14K family protein [Gammaproteobacteria bacterium]|nr:BA14K family protein [Gammaproteobacteria bacterium]
MMLASTFSASAFPAQGVAGSPAVSVSDVQEVRDRPNRRPPSYHRPNKRPPSYHRPHNRPRPGYHNGYHGSNYYRKGYRRYNDGWWYPLAAFGAGAIIGGAIASQPPATSYDGINPRHVQWCTDRYRTYRAYDNTYAPQVGVRAQCYSPYY